MESVQSSIGGAVDGIHDLGGTQGFGAVVTAGDDETVPFSEPWEGRVHGMMLSLALAGKLHGSFRYAIERMDPVEYLESSYYEHWLAGLHTLLTESGVLEEPDQTPDPELAERARAVWRPRTEEETPAAGA